MVQHLSCYVRHSHCGILEVCVGWGQSSSFVCVWGGAGGGLCMCVCVWGGGGGSQTAALVRLK